MSTELRVGVIDSGCSPAQQGTLAAVRRFWLEDGVLREGAAQSDLLGHGSAVLTRLQAEAGEVPVLLAQVFSEQASTSALQVAAALLWLVEEGATVVNLSLACIRTALCCARLAPKPMPLACCCVPRAQPRVARCTRPVTPE
ncbi:hypothetical protein PspTeo4_14288 [Pseudomonas sp. Teo4]|nr:hypothetical protein [Pseudomonas sp. Teo4]